MKILKITVSVLCLLHSSQACSMEHAKERQSITNSDSAETNYFELLPAEMQYHIVKQFITNQVAVRKFTQLRKSIGSLSMVSWDWHQKMNSLIPNLLREIAQCINEKYPDSPVSEATLDYWLLPPKARAEKRSKKIDAMKDELEQAWTHFKNVFNHLNFADFENEFQDITTYGELIKFASTLFNWIVPEAIIGDLDSKESAILLQTGSHRDLLTHHFNPSATIDRAYVARLLLAAGADPNDTNILMWMISLGYKNIQKLLLDTGADPNLRDRNL